eukprot:c5424_g1_i1.p1 GENE.c5424_g1_i1~~c5424_g1_i1.p1  ORF type:complete len:720 (-),score=130.58 c5424_g1_i1:189-2156(-)
MDPSVQATLHIQSMMNICNTLVSRISSLEDNIRMIHASIEKKKTHAPPQSLPAKVLPPPVAAEVEPKPQVAIPQTLHLEAETFCLMFYTDRDYPAFVVRVIDSSTGEVFKGTKGWKLGIRLYDGFGARVDQMLNEEKSRFFHEGVAQVSGLRFLEVSSKNGSHFNLECHVTHPTSATDSVRKVRSENITIFSARLYHTHKAALRLQPHDPVSKLPNIGQECANGLSRQNITSIQDLCRVPCDLDSQSIDARRKLLEAVRREVNTTLTDERLVSSALMARAIVSGEGFTAWLRLNQEMLAKQLKSSENASPPSTPGNISASSSPPHISTQNPYSPSPLAPAPSSYASPAPPLVGYTTSESVTYPQANIVAGKRKFETTNSTGHVYFEEDPSAKRQYVQMPYAQDCPYGFDAYDTSATTDYTNNFISISDSLFPEYVLNIGDSGMCSVESSLDALFALGTTDTVRNVSVSVSTGSMSASNSVLGDAKMGRLLKWPLHTAIEQGSIDQCKVIVEGMRKHNRDINSLNDGNMTPLMLACVSNAPHIVRYLCSLPELNAHVKRPDGFDALLLGVLSRSFDCVAALLECASSPFDFAQLRRASLLASVLDDSNVVEIKAPECNDPAVQEGDQTWCTSPSTFDSVLNDLVLIKQSLVSASTS